MKNLVLAISCFVALGYLVEVDKRPVKKSAVVVLSCDYLPGEVVCK